jgi:hypothetical protein
MKKESLNKIRSAIKQTLLMSKSCLLLKKQRKKKKQPKLKPNLLLTINFKMFNNKVTLKMIKMDLIRNV